MPSRPAGHRESFVRQSYSVFSGPEGRESLAQGVRRREKTNTAHAKPLRRKGTQRGHRFFALRPLRASRLRVNPLHFFTPSNPWDGELYIHRKSTKNT